MTALHQAAQKAVEALKDLLDAHARNTLYSGAGHWEQGRNAIFALEDALQQQPEPVADKRRVAMETVYFRRSPSDQRQDSLTVLAGTATQHVREELIERIASAAGGIAAMHPATAKKLIAVARAWENLRARVETYEVESAKSHRLAEMDQAMQAALDELK